MFVTLRELRRQGDPPADVIVFDIEPERPQKLHNDIRGLETVAVLFGDDDQLYPEVLALREDFPMVPHVNRRPLEFPGNLCLYDQAWADERPSWTPVNFLKRIHTWLSKTADGMLHAPDQPLEPLMRSRTGSSSFHLTSSTPYADSRRISSKSSATRSMRTGSRS